MAFPKTPGRDAMSVPTGPTGIMDSGRKGVTSGGKRTHGSSKGLVCSPGKKMGRGGKMSRYGR